MSTEGPHIRRALLGIGVDTALGDLEGLLLGQIHFELLGQAIGVVALDGAEYLQLGGSALQVLAHLRLIGEDQLLQLGHLVVAQGVLLQALHADFLDFIASLGLPLGEGL